jgi:hypothetical protein
VKGSSSSSKPWWEEVQPSPRPSMNGIICSSEEQLAATSPIDTCGFWGNGNILWWGSAHKSDAFLLFDSICNINQSINTSCLTPLRGIRRQQEPSTTHDLSRLQWPSPKPFPNPFLRCIASKERNTILKTRISLGPEKKNKKILSKNQ